VEPGGKTLEKCRLRRDPDSGMTDPGTLFCIYDAIVCCELFGDDKISGLHTEKILLLFIPSTESRVMHRVATKKTT
jgi:hypothetical protein